MCQEGVVRGVGVGVGRGVGDEVDSNIGNEFGEGVELEVAIKFASINILKMK